jgi:hypothetical protein
MNIDLEAAFWRFDARRKGYGIFKADPVGERDAFKAEVAHLMADHCSQMAQSSPAAGGSGGVGGEPKRHHLG